MSTRSSSGSMPRNGPARNSSSNDTNVTITGRRADAEKEKEKNESEKVDARMGQHHDYDHDHDRQLQQQQQLIRSPFRALIQDFSPIWFTWCMNSGIISILLHQHPYQFHGIRTLSSIFFLIDLLLFIFFSACMLLRLLWFRGQAFHELTEDISQLTLCACWTIGYLTLPPGVSLLVSQAYWGGYWATMLAYVMWWFGAAWTMTILFFAFAMLSRQHLVGGPKTTHENPMPTLVILPAVAVVTCALVGNEVASFSSHMNARLAVPIIIAGLPLTGIGILLGVLLEATLFHQLLEGGFPAPPQITSLFVYIGPFGQSAAALQAIGSAARAWFGEYKGNGAPGSGGGTFLTSSSAAALDTACVLGALLFLGPAVFFTLFSVYGVIDCALSTRKVTWTPSWNAVIFPTATMTTATTYLSVNLDSPFFRVITSIQLVALVAVYLVNLAFTLWGIAKGELLIVREDPRVKKRMEEGQKER